MHESYMTVPLEQILKTYAANHFKESTAFSVEAVDTSKGVVVYRLINFDNSKGEKQNAH